MQTTFTAWVVATMAIICMLHVPLKVLHAQPTATFVPQESTGHTTTRTQWDGVFTEEQSERGSALYAEYCASCHGPGLGGDDRSPSLRGFQFLAAWDGVPLGQLFDRIRTSMPQDDPNSLTREQNADILAFVLH